MDLEPNNKQIVINTEDVCKINGKRKVLSVETTEKRKCEHTELETTVITPVAIVAGNQMLPLNSPANPSKFNAHQSPRKRLQLEFLAKPKSSQQQKANKEKFIYGNYNQYYSYRNKGKDCRDIRLDVFGQQPDLFRGKDVLDIGCNNGHITMEVAKRFVVKSIVGLDIDRSLINQAHKALVRQKKTQPPHNDLHQRQCSYPFNVSFVHGNYVLRDDVLLECECERFDVILCLSITKWIQLNFGDAGLRQSFRRIFRQLRSGGRLILEAQPYDNYGRRKKMTEAIYANYKAITLYPKQFEEYLLSKEVGFHSVELMGVPEHYVAGFKRPIHIFSKQ